MSEENDKKKQVARIFSWLHFALSLIILVSLLCGIEIEEISKIIFSISVVVCAIIAGALTI